MKNLWIVLSFFILSCSSPTSSNKTITGRRDIFFISNRDSTVFRREFYTMTIDGKNPEKLLTRDFFPDPLDHVYNPKYSYALNELFFVFAFSSNRVIYSYNFNSMSINQLTDITSKNSVEAISGDGKKMLFESDRNGVWELFIMDLETKEENKVVSESPWGADISENGDLIIYSDLINIFSIKSDGTDLRQLTFNNQNTFPTFSKNNEQILYHSSEGIFTMEISGENKKQLTNEFSYWQKYSHDGLKIVYISERDGNPELYIMDQDGSNQTRLTFTDRSESEPSFSPDSKRIIYSSTETGNEDIFIINVDGTDKIQLTDDKGVDSSPIILNYN